MAEPEKQKIGDGSDNYGQAAQQAAKAAKQAGKAATTQATAKGAEATVNAAAATIKAGVEGGKAVSEIAAGTAAGGPWGAAISAAWAMRHTLFKVLVCICLCLLFLIVMIVSLPSIILDYVFGSDTAPPVQGVSITEVYAELADSVSDAIDSGYNLSLTEVERIIRDGGYDYDLSMDALINSAQSSAGFDTCYILAAYSVSMEQTLTSADDMLSKLNSVAGSMFPVTYVVKEEQRLVPVEYTLYTPVNLTVVTSQTQTGTINGVPQYRYTTAVKTYYLPGETKTSESAVTTNEYTEVSVILPVYSGDAIVGTRSEHYFEAGDEVDLKPTTETIQYVECTIHPFDNAVITTAFGIDQSAQYNQFNLTYGEAITNMANSLKKTMYGSLNTGDMVSLTDAELIAFVNRQNCSDMRKYILSTALSLVGRVPYFWGGKSAAGWNNDWNTPKLVTAAGSFSTGTIRPYGLDCSGFSAWVFLTALNTDIGAGCNGQYPNTYAVSAADLLPGDLGFLADGDTGGWGHVLIFAGYDENGTRMWVHSTGGVGVVLNTPSYEGILSYRRLSIIDYDAPVSGLLIGGASYTLEVDVTHYCACPICCGSNSDGITASGKPVAFGMVAMSSYYPFGTQIMINGTLYTVEDRGGSGIENNIHRVDIYIADHQEALRLGRFTTTATIFPVS